MYEFLKKLCKERNTNISQLCTEVTGNSGNLATWKKGYMRSDYLAKCADVLGVTTDYILQRGSEDSKNESMVLEFKQLDDNQKEHLISYMKFMQSEGYTKISKLNEVQEHMAKNLEKLEELNKQAEELNKEFLEMQQELSDK